jgi:hypothetical protein
MSKKSLATCVALYLATRRFGNAPRCKQHDSVGVHAKLFNDGMANGGKDVRRFGSTTQVDFNDNSQTLFIL